MRKFAHSFTTSERLSKIHLPQNFIDKVLIVFIKKLISYIYSSSIESGSSKREEVGEFRYVGGLSVRGSYEYVDDEGALHKVNYVADEKGYRPTIVSWNN